MYIFLMLLGSSLGTLQFTCTTLDYFTENKRHNYEDMLVSPLPYVVTNLRLTLTCQLRVF